MRNGCADAALQIRRRAWEDTQLNWWRNKNTHIRTLGERVSLCIGTNFYASVSLFVCLFHFSPAMCVTMRENRTVSVAVRRGTQKIGSKIKTMYPRAYQYPGKKWEPAPSVFGPVAALKCISFIVSPHGMAIRSARTFRHAVAHTRGCKNTQSDYV